MPRGLIDAALAALCGLAVFAFFGHAFLNYDSFYALLWGSDLAQGRTPDFEGPVAPTPHPLLIVLGVPLSLTGDAAEDILLALGLLALGFLAVGLFRLGQELFGTAVGVLAAAIVLTRVPILNFGIRGYVDLPTVALIVWAAVLEVRRPRRGAAVLALLALAGLLRPEAWLFAAAYLAWLAWAPAGRRAAVRLLPLAAAAPVLWLALDWAVTGNPLHSASGTRDLAEALERRTGLTEVPQLMPRRLGEILRLPELLAAVAGFGFGWAHFRDRMYVPTALAVLNALAYTAFGIARLPLLGRYLFLAATMLALFAALGALGWLSRPDPRWRAAGIAALAAMAVLFPLQQVDRLDALRDDIAARDRIQADLRELASGGALERCRRVRTTSHRPIPLLRYWLDRAPGSVSTDGFFDCDVRPVTAEVARLAVLDPNEPAPEPTAAPGPRVASNRSWLVTVPRTQRPLGP